MAKVTIEVADFQPWAGAISTWQEIQENHKEDELDSLLDELYPDGISDTQLNDILWFESDWLYAQLGINDCVECTYCGAINDEEDLEEDELGNKVCPNCEHTI